MGLQQFYNKFNTIMDKQMAFILIAFFIVCACFITWAALGGPKRNTVCKVLILCYIIVAWVCVFALLGLTFLS